MLSELKDKLSQLRKKKIFIFTILIIFLVACNNEILLDALLLLVVPVIFAFAGYGALLLGAALTGAGSGAIGFGLSTLGVGSYLISGLFLWASFTSFTTDIRYMVIALSIPDDDAKFEETYSDDIPKRVDKDAVNDFQITPGTQYRMFNANLAGFQFCHDGSVWLLCWDGDIVTGTIDRDNYKLDIENLCTNLSENFDEYEEEGCLDILTFQELYVGADRTKLLEWAKKPLGVDSVDDLYYVHGPKKETGQFFHGDSIIISKHPIRVAAGGSFPETNFTQASVSQGVVGATIDLGEHCGTNWLVNVYDAHLNSKDVFYDIVNGSDKEAIRRQIGYIGQFVQFYHSAHPGIPAVFFGDLNAAPGLDTCLKDPNNSNICYGSTVADPLAGLVSNSTFRNDDGIRELFTKIRAYETDDDDDEDYEPIDYTFPAMQHIGEWCDRYAFIEIPGTMDPYCKFRQWGGFSSDDPNADWNAPGVSNPEARDGTKMYNASIDHPWFSYGSTHQLVPREVINTSLIRDSDHLQQLVTFDFVPLVPEINGEKCNNADFTPPPHPPEDPEGRPSCTSVIEIGGPDTPQSTQEMRPSPDYYDWFLTSSNTGLTEDDLFTAMNTGSVNDLNKGAFLHTFQPTLAPICEAKLKITLKDLNGTFDDELLGLFFVPPTGIKNAHAQMLELYNLPSNGREIEVDLKNMNMTDFIDVTGGGKISPNITAQNGVIDLIPTLKFNGFLDVFYFGDSIEKVELFLDHCCSANPPNYPITEGPWVYESCSPVHGACSFGNYISDGTWDNYAQFTPGWNGSPTPQ